MGLRCLFTSLTGEVFGRGVNIKGYQTFFFELVLECLQAQGEAPPLLLRKFRDVIHIKIFVFMYNVKSPRMKVAHLSSYYAVKSLFLHQAETALRNASRNRLSKKFLTG